MLSDGCLQVLANSVLQPLGFFGSLLTPKSPIQNYSHHVFVDPMLLADNSGFQNTYSVFGYCMPDAEWAHNGHLPDPTGLLHHEAQATLSSTSAPTLDSPDSRAGIDLGSQARSDSLKRITCSACGTLWAKSKKDFERHEGTRRHLKKIGKPEEDSGAKRFHCSVLTCKYAEEKTFTRKENMKRHLRDIYKIKKD